MARCSLSSEKCIDGGTVLDADVMRYKYAYEHGGVYHDDDARLIVQPSEWPARYPTLDWNKATLIVGVEFPRPRGVGPSGCCLQFVQWAFAASKGSRILHETATRAKANMNHGAIANAVALTGPVLFTNIILKHLGHVFNLREVEENGALYSTIYGEMVIVLPYRAFGVHPQHQNVNIFPSEQQLVRHSFLGRWKNNE